MTNNRRPAIIPVMVIPVLGAFFLEYLRTDQMFFVSVVFTVVISITLHELAHGAAAIRLGDRTPIWSGHMTPNPLVHMGPWSIAALLIAGIAWGAMPIDPTRMRGRYAEAKVAAAGPATNLLLALAALVALGLWTRGDDRTIEQMTVFQQNLKQFLFIFAQVNMVLFAFNLMPAPPLDGAHILANFHSGYARFVRDPSKRGVMIFLFVIVFVISGELFALAASACVSIYRLIAFGL